MDVKDFVEMVMEEDEISLRKIAEKANFHEKTFYSFLNRNNGMGISVNKFIQLTEKLGYQVILSNGETGDEYVFDGENDNFSSK